MFEYENYGNSTYLVYKVGEGEEVNSFALGMLKNNEIEGVLKMLKVESDGKIQIRYPISGKVLLKEYLNYEKLNRTQLLELVYQMAQIIINASEYMIKKQEFVLSDEYIFFDVTIKKVEYILMPVRNIDNEYYSFKKLMKDICLIIIKQTDELTNVIVGELLRILDSSKTLFEFRDKVRDVLVDRKISTPIPTGRYNSSITNVPTDVPVQIGSNNDGYENEVEEENELEEVTEKSDNGKNGIITGLINILKGKKTDKEDDDPYEIYEEDEKTPKKIIEPIVPKKIVEPRKISTVEKQVATYNTDDENTVWIPQGASNITQPYLFRVKTGEHIYVTKNYFKLGRKEEVVDYAIKNPAISKLHIEIIHRGNDYYVIDKDTPNHTWVQGEQLQKEQEVMIWNDCRIRMADEDFIFKLR